ncbi:MAG: 4-hydroxy-tetrahydrodipicolinate synthase [Vulcanimicrobiota bacterium]
MKKLGQLITAMVTPLDKNLNVDYKKAARLAEMLIENGSDGILVVGTTGESPTLTHDEKLKLFQVVKDAIGGAASVIAGTGYNNTRDTVKLTKEAEELGVDAALVVCPYYNKPPQEGIYQHYKTVAGATKLPVIVYNIPGRSGVNITPETMARLSEIPNIVANKEAAGSVDQCSQMVAKTQATRAFAKYLDDIVGDENENNIDLDEKIFSIYCGDDSLTLPMISVGAVGVISVASHIAGPQMKKMIRLFFKGDISEALRIHHTLMPIYKGLFKTANPILVKAALGIKGFDVGGVRPPLIPATVEQIEVLKEDMQKAGLM